MRHKLITTTTLLGGIRDERNTTPIIITTRNIDGKITFFQYCANGKSTSIFAFNERDNMINNSIKVRRAKETHISAPLDNNIYINDNDDIIIIISIIIILFILPIDI
jgi:hypothetical protein